MTLYQGSINQRKAHRHRNSLILQTKIKPYPTVLQMVLCSLESKNTPLSPLLPVASGAFQVYLHHRAEGSDFYQVRLNQLNGQVHAGIAPRLEASADLGEEVPWLENSFKKHTVAYTHFPRIHHFLIT